jgi:C-terminal processing protease CtpA/Prc
MIERVRGSKSAGRRSHPPRRFIGVIGVILALSLRSSALRAQSPAADSVRVERLAALGRLWVTIRYFHPWLAYRPIDWDGALATAVSRISAASDRAGYAAAVRAMLGVLGDSVTRLEPPPTESPPPPAPDHREPDPRAWWTADSVLVVSLRHSSDFEDFNRTTDRLSAIADSIRLARRVVFDLRASPADGAIDIAYELGASGIPGLFAAGPARAPDQRGRRYSGYVPEHGGTSGGYTSGFYTIDGATLPPGDSGASGRTAVLLVNVQSVIPEALLAVRAAGRARIVAEGGVSEAGVVRTYRWELPESLSVSIRLTELLRGGGPVASLADTILPLPAGAAATDPAHDPGLAAAMAALARPVSAWSDGPTWAPSRADPAPGDTSAVAAYPPLPIRLLAGFRIWAVGQYFFPYRDLIGERWDRVLTGAIPRLEAARDAVEYGLALAEMAAHLHDTHVRVTSPALRARFGTGFAPVFVRMIEGQPVVAHFMNDSAVRRSGIRMGDVIVSVDGEEAHARMRRIRPYVSASTPQALERILAARLMLGPVGSTTRLVVRGANQVNRTVELTRTQAFDLTGRTGPLVRVLPGNIGYADLGRLPADQVDSMFERLRQTRAIIFDMRGYPLGTAWPIAPRLTRADMPVATRFTRLDAMTPDTTERTRLEFTQSLPHTDKWRYLRPTVMLIDERTLSQAEHTGLFLEAANRTRFIGSPTSGANGDVTEVALPGGVTMSFSGHAVRHADGRQLQRIGLVPDVPVRPTIAGIRAGRDEVLERALRYLARSLPTRHAAGPPSGGTAPTR